MKKIRLQGMILGFFLYPCTFILFCKVNLCNAKSNQHAGSLFENIIELIQFYEEKKLYSSLREINDKKVCFYYGSFDPFHVGHEKVVDVLLKTKSCDKIIVYSAGGVSSKKPNRTPQFIRNYMINSMYQVKKHVITTNLYPPRFFYQMQAFQKENTNQYIGVVGEDIAKILQQGDEAKYFMNKVKINIEQSPSKKYGLYSQNALDVDRYYVVTRGNKFKIKDDIGGKPLEVIKLDGYDLISSTKIRAALKKSLESPILDKYLPKKILVDIKTKFAKFYQ